MGNGSGRRGLSPQGLLLLVPLFCALPSLVMAAPTGGQVASGTGTITRSGSTTTINQSSQNLSLSWKTFNVGTNETVDFNQPNSSSLAVNRIYDTNGSAVLGHINANGQIYLINPNGILFGSTAQVNVGGLVASTLDTADGSHFAGNGTGSIVNEGTINASHYVALLGNSVTNSGVITATLGTVAMGAGNDVSLTFSGNSLVKLQVNKSLVDSLVANHGLIKADGGTVIMNAGARDTLLASVVNNDGIVQAQTVDNHNGTITLLGGMGAGTVNVGGTLDASAPTGGNGGHIETSAAQVHIAPDAKVTTAASNGLSGSWLIDPVDFTIAASGGDITGSQLSSELSGGNVTIQSSSGSSGSSGDINVDDAVSWSANTLTLNAQNDINIMADLNGSGTARLALLYGQGAVAAGNTSNYYLSDGASVSLPAGTNFSTKLGSDGVTINWTVITSLGSAGSVSGVDLQGMSGDLASNYALGADIDASATSGWNGGSGFEPVGSSAIAFTGSFAGLGHTISNLTVNRLTTNYIGLFGYARNGTLRDVGLLNSSISGSSVVGALAGYSSDSIERAYVAGGSVTADQLLAGGLVGQIGSGGSVSTSYATDNVTGNSNGVASTGIGGLVGQLVSGASISNSYATGSVSGNTDVGGLVGQATGGTVTDSYASGAVTGASYVGGLAGSNGSGGTSATFTDSYWDTQSSGQSSSFGGTGLTTTQMQTASSFGGWSIATTGGTAKTWRIYEGQSYPLLENFLTQLTVTANNDSKTYDGLAYSGGNGVSYSATPNSYLLGLVSYGGSAQGAVNVGSYAITPYGLYSTSQKGYDITFANGTLTVNNAPLLWSAPQNVLAAQTTAEKLLVGQRTGSQSRPKAAITVFPVLHLQVLGSGMLMPESILWP